MQIWAVDNDKRVIANSKAATKDFMLLEACFQ